MLYYVMLCFITQIASYYIFSFDDMRGHGVLRSVGGDGSGNAGSGSGGRVSIHTESSQQYRGAMLAYGFRSTTGDTGGPGSVFVQDMLVRNTEWEFRLYVDGQNAEPPKPLFINETNPIIHRHGIVHDNMASLSFDHMLLQHKVSCQHIMLNCN